MELPAKPRASGRAGEKAGMKGAAFGDWHLGVVWDYVNEWLGIQ